MSGAWKSALFAFCLATLELATIAPATCQQSSQPGSGPPADQAPATKPKRIRVSTGVANAFIVRKVEPVYPAEARRAHIQGRVLLHTIISKEGQVADLQVISGPSELTAAAIDAVRQWRFRPYLLNNEPVEVDTQLVVDFELR